MQITVSSHISPSGIVNKSENSTARLKLTFQVKCQLLGAQCPTLSTLLKDNETFVLTRGADIHSMTQLIIIL